MPTDTDVTTIAHVIQLAVAPVFLLTGVGTILNVMTNRLSRIVDRYRVLERLHANGELSDFHHDEMRVLTRRERIIYRAIALGTLSALLVCGVIALLFVGAVSGMQMNKLVSFLFIGAMLSLIVGLLALLREIQVATRTFHRIGGTDE
jgi:hypothetical protein